MQRFRNPYTYFYELVTLGFNWRSMLSYIISVKAFIANGWDKRLVDSDPDKKYTRTLQNSASGSASGKVSANSNTATATTQLQSHSSADSQPVSWPMSPYTQQIQGILPPILTDHNFYHPYLSANFRKAAET